MTKSYEQTKLAVLQAVKDRAEQTKPMRIRSSGQALGVYLQKCLQSRQMSRVAFAQSLDMETELADAILDGVLPESELHSDLLAELAEAVGCEFDQLARILKGARVSSNGFAPLA